MWDGKGSSGYRRSEDDGRYIAGLLGFVPHFCKDTAALKPLQSALYLSTAHFTREKIFLTVLCKLMGPQINFNNDI